MNDMYKKMEEKFTIIYPNNGNATYKSLMNYSDDLEKPFQRWYRYKEGFSVDLVKNLIKEFSRNSSGIILDPFVGSGTTFIAASELGFKSIGFEVNPFSNFLSKLKIHDYTNYELDEFTSAYLEILNQVKIKGNEYPLPQLSFSDRVFKQEIQQYFMKVKQLISQREYINASTRDLLMLGWLACLEEISNYRKAGNGLKKRKYKVVIIITIDDVRGKLLNQYSSMTEDIQENRINFDSVLNKITSLEMRNILSRNSIEGIIFSPPYANCFDYTEIYKLELWFGDFVKSYSDLRDLRKKSIRSHLGADLDFTPNDEYKNKSLEVLLNRLSEKELWDHKIPKMLLGYFEDMFNIIGQSFDLLNHGGFCNIIVGNSAYGGVIFPTDLLFAEYAEKIGFVVEKIEIDRYLITSSQQYRKTIEDRNLLRESIVCLRKR